MSLRLIVSTRKSQSTMSKRTHKNCVKYTDAQSGGIIQSYTKCSQTVQHSSETPATYQLPTKSQIVLLAELRSALFADELERFVSGRAIRNGSGSVVCDLLIVLRECLLRRIVLLDRLPGLSCRHSAGLMVDRRDREERRAKEECEGKPPAR